MERRGCEAALLPCFVSHSFLGEVAPEVGLSILNVLDAVRDKLDRDHAQARRIGIVTSSYVRSKGLFEAALGDGRETVYPMRRFRPTRSCRPSMAPKALRRAD